MQTVTATFVRNKIADAWEMARSGPLAIENHGEVEFVILSAADYDKLTHGRKPRQAGYARHLFEGVDVDALLATPVPGLEEYMPE